jgi:hypothetical protein
MTLLHPSPASAEGIPIRRRPDAADDRYPS